jgi:hypothetical protein
VLLSLINVASARRSGCECPTGVEELIAPDEYECSVVLYTAFLLSVASLKSILFVKFKEFIYLRARTRALLLFFAYIV